MTANAPLPDACPNRPRGPPIYAGDAGRNVPNPLPRKAIGPVVGVLAAAAMVFGIGVAVEIVRLDNAGTWATHTNRRVHPARLAIPGYSSTSPDAS
jgi:hypothetical protein